MEGSRDDRQTHQAAVLSDFVDRLNAGDEDAATALAAGAAADADLHRLLTIARLLSVQPDRAAVERTSARLQPWARAAANGEPLALPAGPPTPRGVLEITALDHVALPVSDLDRAVGFYTAVLGLRVLSETRTPPPPTTPHIALAAGQARVLVYQALAAGELTPRKSLGGARQFPYVALRVPEPTGVLERLRAGGYAFDGPIPSGTGDASVHLWDPDGNQIDLMVPWPADASP